MLYTATDVTEVKPSNPGLPAEAGALAGINEDGPIHASRSNINLDPVALEVVAPLLFVVSEDSFVARPPRYWRQMVHALREVGGSHMTHVALGADPEATSFNNLILERCPEMQAAVLPSGVQLKTKAVREFIGRMNPSVVILARGDREQRAMLRTNVERHLGAMKVSRSLHWMTEMGRTHDTLSVLSHHLHRVIRGAQKEWKEIII